MLNNNKQTKNSKHKVFPTKNITTIMQNCLIVAHLQKKLMEKGDKINQNNGRKNNNKILLDNKILDNKRINAKWTTK